MESSGALRRQRYLNVAKEVFRKSIHLCSCAVPFLYRISKNLFMILLACALLIYTVCEFLRIKGKTVPVISAVTAAAARKRDENHFVLGPVTLVIGILCASMLYDSVSAAVGIFALAFGDGSASLAGKLFGRIKIPFTQGKTAGGSLTCFIAIFISCFLTLMFWPQSQISMSCTLASLIIATAGMLIEVLPLKDFDNVIIPVALGGLASFISTCI